MFVSAVSVPGAGPEHTYPHRLSGAQVFTGVPAGTGTAGGGLRAGGTQPAWTCVTRGSPVRGGTLASRICVAARGGFARGRAWAWDPQDWKRPWSGGGGTWAWDPHGQSRPWPGGRVLWPSTHVAGRGLGMGGTSGLGLVRQEVALGVGVQAWEHSMFTRAQTGRGDAGHIPLQSPDPPKNPLHPC